MKYTLYFTLRAPSASNFVPDKIFESREFSPSFGAIKYLPSTEI